MTGILPLCGAQEPAAQPTPHSSPAPDERFSEVKESWSSPGLDGTHLVAVPPMSGGEQDKGSYTFELVRVQWRDNDPIDLYVMKPKGVTKPPVVLYIYDHDATEQLFLNEKFQQGATNGGVAAVGFMTALTGNRYHNRTVKQWFVSELPECLATSAHDIQMILDYLQTRSDLDTERIGVFAQGSGASVAILTAATDQRIKVLDAVDPWGDWPNFLFYSPLITLEERPELTTPAFLKSLETLDPVDYLPNVQAKLRLQQARFWPPTPDDAKDRLKGALPKGAAYLEYRTPDDAKEMMKGTNALQWLQGELKKLPPPSAPPAGTTSAAEKKKTDATVQK